MSNLTPIERLQPALLDRLRDERFGEAPETIQQKVITLPQLREFVRRDLQWLLSTESLESTEDLKSFSEIKRSVVNFGLPGLAGHWFAKGDFYNSVQDHIRSAILNFEPRILPDSLQVVVQRGDSDARENQISIEIRAEIWATPTPFELLFGADLDLDTGVIDYPTDSA